MSSSLFCIGLPSCISFINALDRKNLQLGEQFLAFLGDLSVFQALDYKPRLRQPVPEAQESDAVRQRSDERLPVGKLQTSLLQITADDLADLLQLLLVPVDDLHVIHVPDIAADSEPVLDDVVQVVQNRQLYQLRDLTAQPDSHAVTRDSVE